MLSATEIASFKSVSDSSIAASGISFVKRKSQPDKYKVILPELVDGVTLKTLLWRVHPSVKKAEMIVSALGDV